MSGSSVAPWREKICLRKSSPSSRTSYSAASQILLERIDPASSNYRTGRTLVPADPVPALEPVAVGPVRNRRALVDPGQRRLHAERFEDAFAQEARIVLLRGPLDHQGQQRVA